jgi:hypothetical protein
MLERFGRISLETGETGYIIAPFLAPRPDATEPRRLALTHLSRNAEPKKSVGAANNY